MGGIIGSVAVLLVLAALVGAVIFGMVRSKRSGKGSSCSCGCGGCPMSDQCHAKKQEKK